MSQPHPSRAAAAVKQIPSVGVRVCSERNEIIKLFLMHYLLFDLEDADLTDKQKKQALNPHIELRECFDFHVKKSGFIATYEGQL